VLDHARKTWVPHAASQAGRKKAPHLLGPSHWCLGGLVRLSAALQDHLHTSTKKAGKTNNGMHMGILTCSHRGNYPKLGV
jgi:hypothetical protein